MTYKQKLTKIGNSIGLIIPKQLLDSLGLDIGKDVYLEQVQDKFVVTTQEQASISPEFLLVAESIGKRYSAAFSELAK